MDITVINAVISGCFSLAGALIGILASAKLTTYRIEQLEKRSISTIRLSTGSINWNSEEL